MTKIAAFLETVDRNKWQDPATVKRIAQIVKSDLNNPPRRESNFSNFGGQPFEENYDVGDVLGRNLEGFPISGDGLVGESPRTDRFGSQGN